MAYDKSGNYLLLEIHNSRCKTRNQILVRFASGKSEESSGRKKYAIALVCAKFLFHFEKSIEIV